MVLEEKTEACGRFGGRKYFEAVLFQPVFQELDQLRLIVYNQYFCLSYCYHQNRAELRLSPV
jgi:hypothetical protein